MLLQGESMPAAHVLVGVNCFFRGRQLEFSFFVPLRLGSQSGDAGVSAIIRHTCEHTPGHARI